MTAPLLKVEDLTISLASDGGPVPLVKNLSFEIAAGETLCLVGESGCGKSLTALAIIGLLNRRLMRASGGGIFFEGRDLLSTDAEAMRRLRGDRLAMIF